MKIQITLEAARRNAGYTQKEAAGILGVHYQTLAAWEQDSSNVPYAEMVKIQGLYHIPTEFIFFWKPKRVYSFHQRKGGRIA
ncbi:helix-turn-helix transcriptional regulator [Lacticaseibacillus nasuensis]|uniref:helix-turn-helix transcriptional regulator n=1 Tax=Lacticaseibacillus nasuensis TaxID=944671 RepID=UPI000AC79F03|nr:helix-turn-helix transcriptional regulator [Lacticaseibacillus nasuensis]